MLLLLLFAADGTTLILLKGSRLRAAFFFFLSFIINVAVAATSSSQKVVEAAFSGNFNLVFFSDPTPTLLSPLRLMHKVNENYFRDTSHFERSCTTKPSTISSRQSKHNIVIASCSCKTKRNSNPTVGFVLLDKPTMAFVMASPPLQPRNKKIRAATRNSENNTKNINHHHHDHCTIATEPHRYNTPSQPVY